jgi:hypothetical protein
MTRRLLWRTELRLDLQGGCIGAVGDEAWLFICARTLDGLAGHVIALDPHGRERWRHTYEEPGGRQPATSRSSIPPAGSRDGPGLTRVHMA